MWGSGVKSIGERFTNLAPEDWVEAGLITAAKVEKQARSATTGRGDQARDIGN